MALAVRQRRSRTRPADAAPLPGLSAGRRPAEAVTSTARPPRRAPAPGSNGRLSNGPPRTLPAAAPGARPVPGGRKTAIRPRAPRPCAPRERCQGPAAPRPCGRAAPRGGTASGTTEPPPRPRSEARRRAGARPPPAHRRHPRGCSHDAPKHRGAMRPENTRACLETGTGARRAARPAPAAIRPRLREAAAVGVLGRLRPPSPRSEALSSSRPVFLRPGGDAPAVWRETFPSSLPPAGGPLRAVRSLPRRAEVPRAASRPAAVCQRPGQTPPGRPGELPAESHRPEPCVRCGAGPSPVPPEDRVRRRAAGAPGAVSEEVPLRQPLSDKPKRFGKRPPVLKHLRLL